MLLYDTRYRSLTIRAIAAILFMVAAAGWSTTPSPISTRWAKASISASRHARRLRHQSASIPYQRRHLCRAAVVGILNTLLIAFVGCITATLNGRLCACRRTIIARLASTVSRRSATVPVLLWIVAIMAMITETAPPPTAFRGDNATASMISFAVTNRGLYTWSSPGPGWQIVALAFVGSLIAIWLFGRYAARRREGDRRDPAHRLDQLALLILPAVLVDRAWRRSEPDFRVLGRFNFSGGGFVDNRSFLLWVALSLYTGAFIARSCAGILSRVARPVRGGGALGLRPNQVMNPSRCPGARVIIRPDLIISVITRTPRSPSPSVTWTCAPRWAASP